jgi:IS30 family transposase
MEYHQLTQADRYAIAHLHARGLGVREIARSAERSAGTISRELQGNRCKHDGFYRAEKAHSRALTKRSTSRKKSQFSQEGWATIKKQLRRLWSPKQIEGRRRLKRQRPISAETIYRLVRQDRSGGGELWRSLRVMSKIGRKHNGSPATRGKQLGKRHISERPAVVARRRQIGHFEGDTVMGADHRAGRAGEDDHAGQRDRVPRLQERGAPTGGEVLLRHAVSLVGARDQ